MSVNTSRFAHEVDHGKYLAAGSAEEIWGWGTPAGQLRAKRRAAIILEGAAVTASSRVIEVGCGTGLFTAAFAESGAEIVAVDISPDLLAVAAKRNLARVRFVEKNFEDCELEGPFDAVIGSSILHHLDIERALPSMFNLLKPGGRLSFAEPNMLNPQIFCERHFRSFFPQVSPDETAFVRGKLRRQLQACGFEGIAIRPFDWLHPATPPSLISIVSTLGRAFERVWPVNEFAGSLSIRAERPGESTRLKPKSPGKAVNP
jgi:2-polyprenyl-3-methyl-5-hydroxy-6-metoxy-1,4-benzoquinol methylase